MYAELVDVTLGDIGVEMDSNYPLLDTAFDVKYQVDVSTWVEHPTILS